VGFIFITEVILLEMEVDFSGIMKGLSEKEIKDKIRRSVETMAFECESEAKQIVATTSMDTGQFLNSIFTETSEEGDEFSFTMYDGVEYGIYHEYGTVSHWVPFYYRGDTSQPILAEWAHRVLGMDEEEMLEKGGMMVQIDETMPFRKALTHVENMTQEIFNKEFK